MLGLPRSDRKAPAPPAEPAPPAVLEAVPDQPKLAGWELHNGDEIVPGRHALKRLGGGHRYEAYLAWDERLHSLVVIKMVRPNLVEDEHTLRGLAEEGAMGFRLNHPVLLRAFDLVPDGPRPHLVLEHLEGPRLSTLVRRYGALPPEQLIPLGLQLSSALHYMHAERVVHLDVKPSNVIMAAPPRLIDLSVTMDFHAAARLDYPLGTAAYMAPEQCDPLGLGPVGPAADVFALGVTLAQAAAGERPFSEPGPDDAPPDERWPQLVENPRIPDSVPGWLAELLTDCMAPDPELRPAPAQVVEVLEPQMDALPKPRIAKLKPRLTR